MREPFESGGAIFEAFRNNSGVGGGGAVRDNAEINTSRGDVCIFCICLYIVMANKKKSEVGSLERVCSPFNAGHERRNTGGARDPRPK